MEAFQPIREPSITAVPGFRAAGVACGIKASGRPDLALVLSQAPCTAAGTFTTNQFAAAPVLLNRELLAGGGPFRGVVANSGVANACTGQEGLESARRMAALAQEATGAPPGSFFALSTGVIGQQLPMGKIEAGIGQAAQALSPGGGPQAARAMMTTDTVPKTAGVELQLGAGRAAIAGMAKGAGMIQPAMATMLAVLGTDLELSAADLSRLLRRAVGGSFNRISVDGCMSTNDTVLLLANGSSGIRPKGEEDLQRVEAALEAVCASLARQIVRDGEGATKLVEVVVEGAPSERAARRVARAVANSNLVKTALYGADPNWGRILAAAGSVDVPMRWEEVRLWIGEVQLVAEGRAQEGAEPRAHEELAREEVSVRLAVGSGPGRAVIWTCDLSPQYVHENADYRT